LKSLANSVLGTDQSERRDGTSFSEKRREARYPTSDAVTVKISPYNGEPIPATVIDVSKSGLRLELEASLPRHARIQILMLSNKLAIFGEVRYCRRSGGVVHAGVLIEDVVAGRPNAEHLKDDDILLYVAGKGLSAAEVLSVDDHLSKCPTCERLVRQMTKSLYPNRRLPSRGTTRDMG